MRRSLVVANWKMHLNAQQASFYVHNLNRVLPNYRTVEVVLAPSSLVLQPLSLQIDSRKIRLASQNACFKDEGAFTGEVSFKMIRELVHYSIIGHSERRIYFNEDLSVIREKVSAAVRNGIVPILCIGENKSERVAGHTNQVIHDQLTTAISNLTSQEVGSIAIAYEPIWAISTFGGELAKPADIQKAMDYIRYQVSELFGTDIASQVRVLYGGSVDPYNCAGYLALDGCDGTLVGGASLNYEQFTDIVKKAYEIRHKD
jgi:triosephosphate isomerase